jgi:hypothetical protein
MVKAERLDTLVPDFDQPSLCKIDVQGEDPAGDDAHRIMEFLSDRSFRFYDIAAVIRRPIDNAIGQLDLVFVKEDSCFRQEKRGR